MEEKERKNRKKKRVKKEKKGRKRKKKEKKENKKKGEEKRKKGRKGKKNYIKRNIIISMYELYEYGEENSEFIRYFYLNGDIITFPSCLREEKKT